MAKLENLKSFRPGQSGNPNGRPRGSRNISTVLIEKLSEVAPESILDADFVKKFSKGRKIVTMADAFVARIYHEAIVNGESWACRELLDRTEGKAKQSIELTTGAKIQPIAIAIQSAWNKYKLFCDQNNIEYPSEADLKERINRVANERNVDSA